MTKIINFFTRMAPWIADQMVPNFVGVLGVKAGKALVNMQIRMLYLLRGGVTVNYVRAFVSYARFLARLYRGTNLVYVVKYLKTAQIMLMQSVAKQSVRYSSQSFGAAVSCTGTGIPRFIPKAHRAHIRAGSSFHIRLWLTLTGLYRVIEFPGKPSVKTIISPGVVISNSFFGEFIESVYDFIAYHRLEFRIGAYKAWSILSVSPSSPHVGFENGEKFGKYPAGHLFTILNTLYAFRFAFGWQFGRNADFLKTGGMLANLVKAPGMARLLTSLGGLTDLLMQFKFPFEPQLGKLAYKQEPAGKLRVFAMLDPISQWILRPLHNGIFDMLRLITQDATFNQRESVRLFGEQLRRDNVKEVYSFDLTAATDRLPVSLQGILISYFIGDAAASAWIRFLTDRWFKVPNVSGKEHLTSVKALGVSTPSPFLSLGSCKRTYKGFRKLSKNPEFSQVTAVKYAVGQPMGAYSSWAMLALLHHSIVFMAWRRSGYCGKLLYLVLGDDVVIANSSIAEHYLDILSEIGVPVNLSKSIQSSNGSFEFAKRFIVSGVDVSPISWKEMFVARWDINSLMSLAEENSVKLASILAFLDHGYKAISRLTSPLNEMSRSMALTLLWFSRPGSYLSKMDSYSRWLYSSSFNVFHEPDLEAKPLVFWAQQLAMRVLRSLKSPNHFLSPYALEKGILELWSAKYWDTELDRFQLSLVHVLTNMLWTSVFAYYRESMVYDYNAARGTIQRAIMTMKQSLRNPYKVLDALDMCFNTVFESEKEVSSFDNVDLSEWRNVTRVTTLNRCRDLKWAISLRKAQPKLAITPRKALKKGFPRVI